MNEIIKNYKKDWALQVSALILSILVLLFVIFRIDFLPMIILMYISMIYVYYSQTY